MSSTLVYRTISNGVDLSDDLKHAIKRLDLFEQTINGMIVDEKFIPFLEGMKAAGIKDAEKLIVAIAKYEQVELSEEF